MSINQKVPFAVSLTNYIQSKIDASQEYYGQILPCVVTEVNGSFVTVNFQVDTGGEFTFPPVTCPIAESEYVRIPVKVKDTGICIPAATRLGGITGTGTGLAPLGLQPNLGGLVFVPIANINWETLDPNAVVINAPNGSIIRTQDGNAIVTVSQDQIEVQYGNTTFIANNDGVTITGNLMVNGSITGNNGFNISGGSGATMKVNGNMNITGNTNQNGSIAASGDISAGSVTMQTHTHQVVGVQGGQSTITTTVGAG